MMQKRLIHILIGACCTALILMTVILSITGQSIQAPFVPPAFDPSAVEGVPTVPEILDFQELDVQVFSVGICGVIIPKENNIDVWLANPADNSVWIKLRVLNADGEIIGESGLVKPGEYVQTVALRSVPQPGSAITLKVMAYEPETYYSAGAVSFSTTVASGETIEGLVPALRCALNRAINRNFNK